MKQKNQKTCPKFIEGYVIGVDGGGTKTKAALANLEGKVLNSVKTGPSNLRNVGIETFLTNICRAIEKLNGGKNISSIFIGLAAIEEEFKFEKEKIKKEILKRLKFRRELEIDSDQLVAFRSGTDEKNGIVLISGTGCVCHGWKKGKEMKVSGWGWLADEGSGFWTGQRGFQAIFKELDGRGPRTQITKLIFKEWKLKNKEDLLKKIYSKDSIRQISLMSGSIDRAAEIGDKIAKSIMVETGEELARATITVIKKLNFQNQKFPLVLVGRMFRSKIVLDIVRKEIRKVASEAQFIRPKIEPVIGAVKLAIEQLQTFNIF